MTVNVLNVCHKPGSLHPSSHLIPAKSCKVGTIFIPITEMRKLRIRSVKEVSKFTQTVSGTAQLGIELSISSFLRITLLLTSWDWYAAAAAKLLQSCPTLWDPRDGSPPGSPVPGILQARTLEWVAISFSDAWKWKGNVKSLCCARLSVTPWTAAYQAPPSMGFSRQEY